MDTNGKQSGGAHHSNLGLALPYSSIGARAEISADKLLDNLLPRKLDLSPGIRPRAPTHNTPYIGSRRLVGPRRLESLFERKYLVNKRALLGSDEGSFAPQRPSSDDHASVDNPKADLSPSGSALEPRFKRGASRNRNHEMHPRKVTYASLPSSPSQSSSPLPTRIRCLSQVNLKSSNKYDLTGTTTKRLNSSDAAPTDTPKHEEHDDVPAKKCDGQPAYACMERAIDLFLDHNKLLEDIRHVQPFGMYRAISEESDGTAQRDRTCGEAEATSLKDKLPTLKSVVCSLERRKKEDAAGQWSPSDWENATTPRSSTLARITEVDEYTIGALNSVSVTRVSGTEGGHHVVLSALEWERFKRIVSNLISANLVLQAKVRLTQRQFRSLGYFGDLEQTLAKLKSEELRIRRELALRESQFANSFTLSARLQEHKAALATAEQQVDHLKDEARKIKNVKEMLKQAKDSIQSRRVQWQASRVSAPEATTTTLTCGTPTRQFQSGAQDLPQEASGDAPHKRAETPYVEIHRCIRIAANKCFIVQLFVPADAVEQQSAEQQADGKSAAETSATRDRQENSFVLSSDSTTSNVEAVADCERADHDSPSLDLRRVGQLFLGEQMDETIARHSKEILLVVFNVDTGDVNIQPLRLANSEGSTIDPRQANLKAVAEVVCRNLCLSTLPFNRDIRQNNFRKHPCAEVTHHTLKFARAPAIENLIRRRKEKRLVVLADEVDETSIYDAGEELLYAGCHEMRGCPEKGPRHYLIHIYSCCPRYLVARVFSPRSVVFHSCWIDAFWAMQIYENSMNLVSPAPPLTTVPSKTTVPSGRLRTPRDGKSTPQYGAASPSRGAVTPREYSSGASDMEEAAGDRKMVASTWRDATDVKHVASSSATAFNPSFIRFVATSLRFDKDALCFTPAKARATADRKPLLSVKKSERRLAPSCRGKRDLHFGGNEKEDGYEHENELDSSIASQVSGEADINTKGQRRLCDIRERQRILQQSLLNPQASPSTCNQALNITHAQIVQRSRISKPESFEACFVLIQSCIALEADTVTFVVYEPASSWRAESSFSLIDALTLIHKRKRTFTQRLGVDKPLLEELLSAVKSNSTAAPHRLSCTHVYQNGHEDKETRTCGGSRISPPDPPRQERDNLLRVDISRGFAKGSPFRGSEQVCAAENRLNDVVEPCFAAELSESAKQEDMSVRLVSAKERSEGRDDTGQGEQPSHLGVQAVDEKERVFGTDESTAPCVLKRSARDSGVQDVAPTVNVSAVSDLTKSSMLEKQKSTNRIAKTSSTPIIRHISGNLEPRRVKSLPASTETMTAELGDAKEESSAEGVLPSDELLQSDNEQKHEPDAFVGKRMPPASPVNAADDANPERSGSANTLNADLAQNRARALDARTILRTSDGGERQSRGVAAMREHLSEAQWKSLVREIFAGLKVSGNDIVIPGLSTVPVVGLWKIVGH